MADWLACPHPRDRERWRVLTPCRTQAAAAGTRDEAISKATRMIADEGGGYLTVIDLTGLPAEHRRVAPSLVPYCASGTLDEALGGALDGSDVPPVVEEEGAA